MGKWKRIAQWLGIGCGVLLFYLLVVDFRSEQIIVAVLDTGIDLQHEKLQGQLIPGFDFVDFDRQPDDTMGHGTHVAGIVAAHAPKVQIMPVRIINDDNKVKHSALGILYATLKGASVINMSYAESYHFLTDLAIRFGTFKNVVFVASSGNLGIDDVFYPAKYEGVFSIGGWNEEKQEIFGNYGQRVHFVAPGYRVVSAAIGGGEVVKSGTSMSAGYMSGVIAYMMGQEHKYERAEILDVLERQAAVIGGEYLPLAARLGMEDRMYKAIDMGRIKTVYADEQDGAQLAAHTGLGPASY